MSTPVGAGRVLAVVYGFFVLASGARSVVQISTQFTVAPLAYVLSAAAPVVYASGLVLMVRAERGLCRAAVWWCRGELVAVLAVGVLTMTWRSGFPDQTVWSDFGRGYWFVPLALPVAALAWLHRGRLTTPSSAPRSAGRPERRFRPRSRDTGTVGSDR